MAGQVEDDIDAAAGTVSRQIADFDDRLALDRLAGEAGDGGFDRLVEVGFEEQPVLAGAAPAGGCHGAAGVFQQHQVGRKTADTGTVMTVKNVGNEALCRNPPGCADNSVANRRWRSAGGEDFLDGSQFGLPGSRYVSKNAAAGLKET